MTTDFFSMSYLAAKDPNYCKSAASLENLSECSRSRKQALPAFEVNQDKVSSSIDCSCCTVWHKLVSGS